MFKVPEALRADHPHMGTAQHWRDHKEGGFFVVPASRKRPYALRVIASSGEDWEHVSVSTAVRCPTWEEMCYVKGLFWGEEDTVVQYHPAKSEYVNNHQYCLHLWRPIGQYMPVPPSILVGLKGLRLT